MHQQHTRSNNPLAILEDDAPDNNNDNIADDITVQADNCTNGAMLGTSLQLVCQPARHSKTLTVLTNPIASPVHDLRPTATPTLILQPRLIQSTCHIPNANPSPIAPQCLLQSTMPIFEPTTPRNQQPYPHYILSNDDKRNTDICRPDRAICLLSKWGPASIAAHALYLPTKLNDSLNRFQHNINIEEVCNGVVHPITTEMITKYTKLIYDPALKGLSVPAMSKELHHLAQGKEGITVGTNIIFYLTHDEIRWILKDHTITYARIVIDRHPQKDDPNCVHITVGGNLINYPYELTKSTADMVSAKLCGTVSSEPGEPKLVMQTSRTCILKPHLIDTSKCECPSSSFQMTSSLI
jgi:hypothetical protein